MDRLTLDFVSTNILLQCVLTSGQPKGQRKIFSGILPEQPLEQNLYLISTITTMARKMMIITKVARIPLKVPMMLAQPAADGSSSPCVAASDTDGVSDDVVFVVDSEVTTDTNGVSDDVVFVVDSEVTTDTDGVSNDVVFVVDSEVTTTPTNLSVIFN